MNITTLAAWGEFLGGIAVVFSLIYLASQIRQNSRLLQASTSATRAENFASPAILQVQDPEVARVFWEGMADRDALSEADRRRFDPLLTLMLAGHNQQYEFVRDRLATLRSGEQMELALRVLFEQRGARQWWREWSRIFPGDFRSYVDGLISEAEAAA
jgi:hypothetical protein